jgi:hypothetical protein
MIGGCSSRHNVTFIRTLGCSTCDHKRAEALAATGRLQESFDRAQCFFVQNMPPNVQIGIRAPAIVHGLTDNDRRRFFEEFAVGMPDRKVALQARAREAARGERRLSRPPPPPPVGADAGRSEGGAAGETAGGAVRGDDAGQPAVGQASGSDLPHHVAAAQWGQLPRAVQLMLGGGTFTEPAAGTVAGTRR